MRYARKTEPQHENGILKIVMNPEQKTHPERMDCIGSAIERAYSRPREAMEAVWPYYSWTRKSITNRDTGLHAAVQCPPTTIHRQRNSTDIDATPRHLCSYILTKVLALQQEAILMRA